MLLLACSTMLQAQSLSDGVYMPKGAFCGGFIASQESWDQYYEGSLLRTNGNIGTVTTQSAAVMANYGISDRLNVIAMLPYVTTKASAGTLAGQKGMQDLTLGLKYKLTKWNLGGGSLSPHLIGGITTPVTNYVADYLPLSIGMHSRNAFGRLLLNYYTNKNITASIYGSYIGRSSVTLDRSSYYTTHLIESNKVAIPAVGQFGARVGYYSYRWQAEGLFETTNCLSGNDIRRQDMPFLSNKTEATRVGIFLSYRIKPLRDIQIIASGQQTLSGRNVGKARTYAFGIMKAFGRQDVDTATAN
jgi:hypothetical protein